LLFYSPAGTGRNVRPRLVRLLPDRVIVMRGGALVAQGFCDDVLSTQKADYRCELLDVAHPPTCI
jgi:ABC-type microcin C transport system duplicated ATPase subunit YejF